MGILDSIKEYYFFCPVCHNEETRVGRIGAPIPPTKIKCAICGEWLTTSGSVPSWKERHGK